MDPNTPESIENQRDRTDSNAINSTTNNFLLTVINRLTESLDQNNLNNVVGVELPEFKGLPSECIYSFLDRFTRSTSGLNEKNKIKALVRSLKGDAQLWARNHLVETDNTKPWSEIEQSLKSRFGMPNRQLSNLQKASKMKFDPDRRTLTSYVEQFAYYYKSTQKDLSDNFIITQLDINLEPKVKVQLSLLDDNWTDYQSLDQLYTLIKRFEKLTPLHTSSSTSKPITEASLDAKLTAFTQAMSDKINSLVSGKEKNDYRSHTKVAATTTNEAHVEKSKEPQSDNSQTKTQDRNYPCDCNHRNNYHHRYRSNGPYHRYHSDYRRQPYGYRRRDDQQVYQNQRFNNQGYEPRSPRRFYRPNQFDVNEQGHKKNEQTRDINDTATKPALNYQESSKMADSMIQKP